MSSISWTALEEYDSPNCIEENLQKVKTYIEKRGVKDPNIFPASALVALSSRLDERPGPFTSWPRFVEQYQAMDIFKFDDYYAFNHLPQSVQEQNNALLNNGCTREQEVDLHSGVKCVEQAIALYIDKYARPTKVFDLTKSFNEKLKEVAAFENLVVSISKDKEKAKRIKTEIAQIRQRIGDAKRASDFSKSLDEKTKLQSKKVGDKINELVDPLLKEITSLIASDSKLPIEQAKSKCFSIESKCQEMSAKLISQVESIVEEDYKKVVDAIIQEYKKQLSALSITDGEFARVDPLKLVAGEFDRIDDFLKESTREEVVGQKSVTRIKSVFEESNRKWYNLWGLGIFGHGDRFVEKPVTETEDIIGKVVDMAKLTDEYLIQYQLYIDATRNTAVNYTEEQKNELIKRAEEVKRQIDQILSDKLRELEKVQSDDKALQEGMLQKEKNLQWLQSIQTRINNLIVF